MTNRSKIEQALKAGKRLTAGIDLGSKRSQACSRPAGFWTFSLPTSASKASAAGTAPTPAGASAARCGVGDWVEESIGQARSPADAEQQEVDLTTGRRRRSTRGIAPVSDLRR